MNAEAQEIQTFLASVISTPYADMFPCIFWFCAGVLVIGLIGLLGVIAVSDAADAKRTIYTRQLMTCSVLSGVAMGLVTYFDFVCLIIPFALLTLVLVAGLLWYSGTSS